MDRAGMMIQRLLLIIGILEIAVAVPIKDNTIEKRRESTKETIELEETLKRLAGEDKKYFSNSMAMPMPQVDGLEDLGSGEEGENEDQLKPLEEQLQETHRMLDENKAFGMDSSLKSPIPGPYGPGLAGNHGDRVEYEPDYIEPLQHNMILEQEQEDDDYFMERVLETIRSHPEVLAEILQDKKLQGVNNLEELEERTKEISKQKTETRDENDLRHLADYEDSVNEIQAELAAIRGQQNREREQAFDGDKVSHIVAKKHSPQSVLSKEIVKDDLDALNKYFDKYSSSGDIDVPIM